MFRRLRFIKIARWCGKTQGKGVLGHGESFRFMICKDTETTVRVEKSLKGKCKENVDREVDKEAGVCYTA